MRRARDSWIGWGLFSLGLVCLAGGILLLSPRSAFSASNNAHVQKSDGAKQGQTAPTDPWTSAQTVEPAALVKELNGPRSSRPVVVSVSPRAIYIGGHIPGAVFQGPGFNAQAIDGLKHWAERLPRSTNLVVYCGCCPLVHCPNLRPAFRALQSMGFTRLRALILPTNFYTDWYSKGYPTAKGN